MYWKKPSVVYCKRLAAPVKQSKGRVVTTPALINNKLVYHSFNIKLELDVGAINHQYINAIGSKITASSNNPGKDSK